MITSMLFVSGRSCWKSLCSWRNFRRALLHRVPTTYARSVLGYANIGTVLMTAGIPYDSPKALAIAGALSAIMSGESYAASAEMAKDLGAFPRYASES